MRNRGGPFGPRYNASDVHRTARMLELHDLAPIQGVIALRNAEVNGTIEW